MDHADEDITPYDKPRGSVASELLAKHLRSKQPESQQICVVLGAILEVLDGEGMEATPSALFAAIMSSLQSSKASSGKSQQSPQASPCNTSLPTIVACPHLSDWTLDASKGNMTFGFSCGDHAVRPFDAFSPIIVRWNLLEEERFRVSWVGLLQICAAMGTILSATLSRVPEAVLRSKFAASSEILCCLVEEHAEQVSLACAAPRTIGMHVFCCILHSSVYRNGSS